MLDIGDRGIGDQLTGYREFMLWQDRDEGFARFDSLRSCEYRPKVMPRAGKGYAGPRFFVMPRDGALAFAQRIQCQA